MVALIAVIDLMKTTWRPAKKAGKTRGSITRRKVVKLPAPRLNYASSMLRSIRWSNAMVVRIPAGL
jgi:hypothetical protein